MGYSTDFSGQFNLDKRLDDETFNFLNKFANTRRMARHFDQNGTAYGVEGEFYVDGKGSMGQDTDETVIDGNRPPRTQPGLWCQWIPTEDHMSIEWDGGEKFYNYEEWLLYIINNFLAPKGYTLNGQVKWQGEYGDDFGILKVRNNIVTCVHGQKFYNDPEETPAVKKPRKKRISKSKAVVAEPVHKPRRLNLE